jgi:hypothetical protein
MKMAEMRSRLEIMNMANKSMLSVDSVWDTARSEWNVEDVANSVISKSSFHVPRFCREFSETSWEVAGDAQPQALASFP